MNPFQNIVSETCKTRQDKTGNLNDTAISTQMRGSVSVELCMKHS